ncbi:Mbeg1-like protein [Butyrivibrio proteoclasticus]|uniref:Mbeg1-like protein n=1 Tax=Butyrivibrio proteoclasticus TaxID=43305 RepID=UPI000684D52E|nr:Mbeg1-like protein [Butyrivibrio proteoclasticus]
MNTGLSIEEIVFINNLLYLDNLGGPKGTFLSEVNETKTIGDYIDSVLDNASEIDDSNEYFAGMTGFECKQILKAAGKNQHLRDIIIESVHFESTSAGGGKSALLYDPEGNEAIVAFRGTESDAEWVDNVEGLYMIPTAFQQNALNWYQSLDLTDCDVITVTGHSKGGNKAVYITLMDNTVDNCISFDGQGFSDEFIDKYADIIRRRQDRIHTICAESDYVNLLLNEVGTKQFYLGTNYGRLGFGENHCPNAILFFDEYDDAFLWKAQGQDPKMADLDKMFNSFIRSIPAQEKEDVAKMVGNIIIGAIRNNQDAIFSTFSDKRYSESASDLLAFILRYKMKYPKMVESLKEILSQNNIDTDVVGVVDFITNHSFLVKLIGLFPWLTILVLRLKGVDKNVLTLLKRHKELFKFLVKVADKMNIVNPDITSGADKKIEMKAS